MNSLSLYNIVNFKGKEEKRNEKEQKQMKK